MDLPGIYTSETGSQKSSMSEENTSDTGSHGNQGPDHHPEGLDPLHQAQTSGVVPHSQDNHQGQEQPREPAKNTSRIQQIQQQQIQNTPLSDTYTPGTNDDSSILSLPSSDHSYDSHVAALPNDTAVARTPSLQSEKTVAKSTTSSSPWSTKVPLSQRRGLLAFVVLLPELEDARDYPDMVKHLITFIVALAAISGPMGTSIMLPALDDIVKNLHTTNSIVNVSVGVYVLALGIFPLWWSAFSEKWGRRTVYMVSFGGFLAFSIGTSLAPNITALLVIRIFQGGFSSSVQALGAGTISDIYAIEQRGTAMGYYYLGPLMGPFLAPIIGGALSGAWGWRATQWFLVIVSAINFMMLTFLMPETLRKVDNFAAVRDLLRQRQEETDSVLSEKESVEHDPVLALSDSHLQSVVESLTRISTIRSSINQREEDLLEDAPVGDPVMPSLSRLTTNRSTYSRKVVHDMVQEELKREESKGQITETKWQERRRFLYDVTIRPLHALVLLTNPQIGLVVAYASCCFAAIYFFNLTISYEYARPPYNFKPLIEGLLYIPNSLTYLLASIVGGKWMDRLLLKYAKKHNGHLMPEARISWNIVTSVCFLIPACLIFGWTLKTKQFWLVPLIGTAMSGFGSMLMIGTTATYLVDSLPGKGATGIALNNFIRQVLGAIGTFVVEPLLRAIGPGILFSILAGIVLAGCPTLIILKRYGKYFRENYDLGALYDKL